MHYFFDTVDGDVWTRDDTGLEADNLEQARMMAQGGLADMVREQPSNGRFIDLAIRIRKGRDTVVVKMVLDSD